MRFASGTCLDNPISSVITQILKLNKPTDIITRTELMAQIAAIPQTGPTQQDFTALTQTLTAAGSYTELFTSVDGCDSTVVLTLTVNPLYNETDAVAICDGDSYTFGTQTLTAAGTYTEVFPSMAGCDSTVVAVL